MARYEYETKRRTQKPEGPIRGKSIEKAAHVASQEKKRQKQSENFAKLRTAEIIAQEIIDQLPHNAQFTIVRRNDNSPNGESEYQIYIKNKDDNKINFVSTDNSISESRNYVSFCIETRLLIRDNNNNFTKNTEKLEELLFQHNSLPKSRNQQAA